MEIISEINFETVARHDKIPVMKPNWKIDVYKIKCAIFYTCLTIISKFISCAIPIGDISGQSE